MTDHTRRLLPVKDAAAYCGVPSSYFPRVCPAKPVKLYDRARPRYDIIDLDNWIDSIKTGAMGGGSDDDIISKL